MKKIIRLFPLAWFADIGHGILLTFIIAYFFSIEPQLIHFIFGIIFSILPDIDGVKELIIFKKVAASEENPRDHRDGLHYPIIWVVVGILVIFFEPFWGTLALSAVLIHFVNDSWGAGWGVQWLWPLNKNSYKFFSRKDVDSYVGLENFVIYWTPEEKPEYIKRLGNPNWLDEYYLQFNRPQIIFIEYGAFIFALTCLLVYVL